MPWAFACASHAPPSPERTPSGSRHRKKLLGLSADERVDLWAMDAVHCQQYGSRCRMWVPPEATDPVVLHHPGRQSVGYFGAVRLRDGKLAFRREEQRFNAVTCWGLMRYLRQISSKSGHRVVAIADNARSHHAVLHQDWRQQCAQRFALDFLPPYSPELNPIERLWKLVRRLCLHNRSFPTLEAVIDAVEPQFIRWVQGHETARRFCAII